MQTGKKWEGVSIHKRGECDNWGERRPAADHRSAHGG